jgi:hypothetical protein
MRKFAAILLFTWRIFGLNGQGLLNNGAQIVITNGSNIYIDGTTGHYTNQSGGVITNNTNGATITLLGNWINNASNVAFSNDGATVVMAGANQTIGGSNPTAFYNLSLSGSGTKQLAVNQNTVGGQSVFTGLLALGSRPLDLNSNRLTITNSAVGAITYGTGYVISETNTAINPSIVRWYVRNATGSHVYPFGLSGTQIPFTFNITTAMPSASDYVDVSTRATSNASNTPWEGTSNVGGVTHMYSPVIGADGSQQVVVDRWWDITATNTLVADVTFSYLGAENTLWSPYNTGNLGAQHWDGSAWEPPVGSAPAATSGVGAVTASGLSVFSPWVLSSLSAPLPIELIDMKLNCLNGSVVISWATATERDNDHFTIFKSYDGIHFSSIATITGAGTSYITHNYSYTDNAVEPGKTVYYKLTQTDKGGTPRTLQTLSTESCDTRNNEIKVNNTAEGKVTVSFYLKEDGLYVLNIYDVLGRQLKSQDVKIQKGFDVVELQTSGLAESYYLLQIKGDNSAKTQKIYVGEGR